MCDFSAGLGLSNKGMNECEMLEAAGPKAAAPERTVIVDAGIHETRGKIDRALEQLSHESLQAVLTFVKDLLGFSSKGSDTNEEAAEYFEGAEESKPKEEESAAQFCSAGAAGCRAFFQPPDTRTYIIITYIYFQPPDTRTYIGRSSH